MADWRSSKSLRLVAFYGIFASFFLMSGIFQQVENYSQLPLANWNQWLAVFFRFFFSYLIAQFLLFSLWPKRMNRGIKVEVDQNEEPPSLYDLFDDSEVKKVKPETNQKMSRRERFKRAMGSNN